MLNTCVENTLVVLQIFCTISNEIGNVIYIRKAVT